MQYSKLKTLLIYNILEKYSDEEHPLSTTDLISMLEEKGVKCERKSIYADIAALNDIGYYYRNKSKTWLFYGFKDF